MRRPWFTTLIAFLALVTAGCSDERAPSTAPLSPEASALLSATAEVSDVRAKSDELLREPARTLARYALAKVQSDINYKRSTVYLSSLAFAAIPLFERKMNRIPEENAAKLVDLLCALSKLIGPHVPATIFQIPWCKVAPEELGNEAKFQLVSNSTGAELSSASEQVKLSITANTMRDAAGNPVQSAFFSILPLSRQPGLASMSVAVTGAVENPDAHVCPIPWDPDYAKYDCYPEFYEIAVQPPVQFVGTPAVLQICQLDPHSQEYGAPTHTVANRLKLFSQAGNSEVSILQNSGPTEGSLVCDGDPDLHPVAIGPIEFSREGLRNALAAAKQLGGRALRALGPKTAYASNFPTHGDVLGEFLGVGNIVGAIDYPVVRVASVQVSPQAANTFVGGNVELSRAIFDKLGAEITEPTTTQDTEWSSSNPSVATVQPGEDPSTAVVTGVAAGTATITVKVHTGEGDDNNENPRIATATATITVDPNASFVGIWNGTVTAPGGEHTQPVTIIVTTQAGNSATGEFRVASAGESEAYNQERFFTGQVAAATLTFRLAPFVSIPGLDVSVSRTGSTLSGTVTEDFGEGQAVWTTTLSLGEAATVAPPPVLTPGFSVSSVTPTTETSSSSGARRLGRRP